MPHLLRTGLAILVAVSIGDAAVAEETPRASMHRLFEALAFLLPASFDEERFADPAEREAILARMGELSAAAGVLEDHARSRDAGFRFLSRSLARDVREIEARFRAGRGEESRYFLYELSQTCVACHSRLPKAREYPLADRLLQAPGVKELSPRERARLQVATRRFDDALATWEGLFADPEVAPQDYDLAGDFVDYLSVCIRVQGDLQRPQRTLGALLQRSELPLYLRSRIEAWIGALRELERGAPEEPTLERARGLVETASSQSPFPGGRERLVYDLMASSVLHRYVDRAGEGAPGLAEAFYLLGVIEARTVDSYWVPQAEFHLEAAVRADPSGPFARPAYDLLEEYIVIGYGGSSGVHVPPDVADKLAELRGLVEASPAEASGD